MNVNIYINICTIILSVNKDILNHYINIFLPSLHQYIYIPYRKQTKS